VLLRWRVCYGGGNLEKRKLNNSLGTKGLAETGKHSGESAGASRTIERVVSYVWEGKRQLLLN